MTTDIVVWLRELDEGLKKDGGRMGAYAARLGEAADEIERLRDKIAKLEGDKDVVVP